MMELREYLITSWPLTDVGTKMDFREMDVRRVSFMAALLSELPLLQQLQACELLDSLQITNAGAVWQAVLQELPQMGLQLSGKRSPAFDAFEQEIEWVRKAQDKLPSEYWLAFSPARDPANDERTATLRRRAKRHGKGGRLSIATQHDQCELLLPSHMPDQMPLAELCSIDATVLQLTRTRALVKLKHAAQLSGAGTSQIPAGTELQMLRGTRFSDVAAGHRLQAAMDTRQVLQLRAAVVRRWDDGTISQLELHDFLNT